jgi:hypothetical protein
VRLVEICLARLNVKCQKLESAIGPDRRSSCQQSGANSLSESVLSKDPKTQTVGSGSPEKVVASGHSKDERIPNSSF